MLKLQILGSRAVLLAAGPVADLDADLEVLVLRRGSHGRRVWRRLRSVQKATRWWNRHGFRA